MLDLSIKEQKQILGGRYIVFVFNQGKFINAKFFNLKIEAQTYADKVSNHDAGIFCIIKNNNIKMHLK